MAKRPIDYSSFFHVKEDESKKLEEKAVEDLQELLYELKQKQKRKTIQELKDLRIEKLAAKNIAKGIDTEEDADLWAKNDPQFKSTYHLRVNVQAQARKKKEKEKKEQMAKMKKLAKIYKSSLKFPRWKFLNTTEVLLWHKLNSFWEFSVKEFTQVRYPNMYRDKDAEEIDAEEDIIFDSESLEEYTLNEEQGMNQDADSDIEYSY